MEILFDTSGNPMMVNSTYFFGETIERRPAVQDTLAPYDLTEKNIVRVDAYEVRPWGVNNDFPQIAAKECGKTSVLNTGLKFLRNLTIGQGIYACKVDGYDDDGNEVLKPINDPKLIEFITGRQVRRYMETVLRDYMKFGNGAVELMPSSNGNFCGLNTVNALYRRYTYPQAGKQQCLVSGHWPSNPKPGEYTVLDVLSPWDPALHADMLKLSGKLKKSVVYPICDSWSNEDIYGEPIWWTSFLSGWVEISHLVPKFLAKAYKNQITWKWHVQIPYSFWEKKFPTSDYKGNMEARKMDIQKYMDMIEKNLCGVENAEKPIFSMYAVNEMNGKIEEEWKITALDNKYKGGDNLVTSAAANSEILFSLMVNPNVLGAGMPGGTYAGNQGGSNIREAFLVNIAMAWIDRQNILDPLELYIKMNGLPQCELRFRNTILTTLDTGAGTKKTLS